MKGSDAEHEAAQATRAITLLGGRLRQVEPVQLPGLPDKRALIVPRTEPRLEQFMRASRAAELGLVSMLSDDGTYDPAVMAAALRALPRQNLPSEVVVPGLLEGLKNVARLVQPWIEPVEIEADAEVRMASKVTRIR